MTNWSTFWRNSLARLQIGRLTPEESNEEKFQRELRADFTRKMKEIARGKRKHPVMMTSTERHDATCKATKKMKWSKHFVTAMTVPLAVRALENGGYAKDPLSGKELLLSPNEMKRLAGVTRKNFKEFKDSWSDQTITSRLQEEGNCERATE